MPLPYHDALARLQGLHAELHAIATDIEAQQHIWMKINKDSRIPIDKALKKAGVATVDDLVKKVIGEIDDAEKRAQVQKIMDEFTPSTSWTGIVWDHIKDPITDVITIGKFIAINHFIDKAVLYNAKSWELSIAQTRVMGAINSAYRARVAANFANQAIRGVNMGLNAAEIAQVEKDIKLSVIDEAAEGEEVDWAAAFETAADGAAKAEMALRAARNSCIYAVVFVVVISTAEWAYNKYQEEAASGKMKEAIVRLCTARLYATQDKNVAQTFSALAMQGKQIANAIIDNKPIEGLLDMYVSGARDLQGDAMSDERLKETFNELHEQDLGDPAAKDRLGDDPEFDTMTALHKKDLDDARSAVKAQAESKKE